MNRERNWETGEGFTNGLSARDIEYLIGVVTDTDYAAYQRGREDAAKAVEALHFPDPHCHTEPTYEADGQAMIGCGFCWDGEYRFDKWPCDSILAARGDGEQP